MSLEINPLSEVAEVIDSLHKTPKYSESGYPMVRGTDIKGGVLDFSNSLRVDEATYEEFSRRYKPSKNDILISRVGTYGNTAIVEDAEFCLGQNTSAIIPKINPTYLYYVLNSPDTKHEIECKIVGSTQKTLSLKAINSLEVPRFGTVAESNIAEILSSLDEKIELNHKQNRTLEAIAQALFKRWFVEFEFPDENGRSYKSSGGAMQPSELGEIPVGWKVGVIEDLVEVLSGYAFKSRDFSQDGQYRLVTIRNVKDGVFFSETENRLNTYPSNMPGYCLLREGDILLSLTGNVGRVCSVIGESYLLNQRVAKLNPVNRGDIGFAYTLFRSSEIKADLELISKGTAQQNLSPVETKKLELCAPTRVVLDYFAEVVNPIYGKLIQNNRESSTLAKVRDTLLPKLLSGELRVG